MLLLLQLILRLLLLRSLLLWLLLLLLLRLLLLQRLRLHLAVRLFRHGCCLPLLLYLFQVIRSGGASADIEQERPPSLALARPPEHKGGWVAGEHQ